MSHRGVPRIRGALDLPPTGTAYPIPRGEESVAPYCDGACSLRAMQPQLTVQSLAAPNPLPLLLLIGGGFVALYLLGRWK